MWLILFCTALYLSGSCLAGELEVEPNSLSKDHRSPHYDPQAVKHFQRHTHRSMIQALCKHGHVYSEVVRNAMLRVDRKNFFSKVVNDPYRIKSRLIGFGADISSPHIHAQMLELLKDKIKPGARILDIGSGSGYLTACLAYMAGPTGRVYGVEHVMELAEASIKNIDKGNSELLDQGRVQFVVWNGKHGYEREAPYDIIHVSPSYFTIPQKLLDQLVPGGRMLMPIGEPFKGQNLTIIDKLSDGYTIVTTVVRRVRTNPLYRDRFQQRKYFNELRRKAAEIYNQTRGNKVTSYRLSSTKQKYQFMTNPDEHLEDGMKQEPHEQQWDHSISEEIGNPEQEINERNPLKGQAESSVHGQEPNKRDGRPRYSPIYPNTKADSEDYEMRSTTPWRWRQYYTHLTNNWIDYDEGFDPENPYNLGGADHGEKLDHTEGIDYIYPDPAKMTFHHLTPYWGNGEVYRKWYNDNYVGVNSTPWNPVYKFGEADRHKLDTKKPLPSRFWEDAAHDSFPDHLFPFSDYFNE